MDLYIKLFEVLFFWQVWGFSVGSRMNLMTGIVLYAAISKHMGLPLKWPGTPEFYNCLYNIIDTDLLAEAMCWVATTAKTKNNAYNLEEFKDDIKNCKGS